MPQSWDMGQILSLPLRRKACWPLFGHPKNLTASVRFEPANSGTRPPKPRGIHILPFQVRRILYTGNKWPGCEDDIHLRLTLEWRMCGAPYSKPFMTYFLTEPWEKWQFWSYSKGSEIWLPWFFCLKFIKESDCWTWPNHPVFHFM